MYTIDLILSSHLANNLKCTENSGTLSYKEISEIIEAKQLTPVYDRDNAVKYIVWDNDQWVSYVSLIFFYG